ncbi:MAG: hypothetical protein CSA45_07030 [Gammaproteobacteria bacterium]|nr:MAG: hypothetical protein CSA45_07030 [Gammaproteobacteria bacterium]
MQDNWQVNQIEYAGFAIRLVAAMPFVGTVIFWIYRSATPGKIMLKLKVLDADTGKPLSAGKAIIRYLAYFISAIPLCLGYIWIIFNPKKQGWHDLIANTVVVRSVNDRFSSVKSDYLTDVEKF